MKRKNLFSFPLFFIAVLSLSFLFVNDCTALGTAVGTDITKDASVRANNPDTNYATSTDLYVGCEDGSTAYYRAYIDFNVTDLVNAYQLGIYDSQISLRLYGKLTTIFPLTYHLDIEVYRVTEDWNETDITWNNQPSHGANVTWKRIDGSTTDYQYLYFDISDDFLDVLVNGGEGFYGYMLSLSYGSGKNNILKFYSDENGSYEPSIFYGDTGDDESEESEEGTWVTDYILVFLFVGAPALLGGSATRSIQGFLFGACVGIGAGVMAGFIPYWFIFLMVLALLALIMNIGRGGRG